MKAAITTELIRKLPAGPCDVWDTKLPGFVLRIRQNGRASYLASLGRGTWHTIGPVERLAPAEARETARGLLGEVSKDRAFGRDPLAERRKRRAALHSPTLKAFLADAYEPWALEHQKRGAETVQRMRSVFVDLMATKLADITPWTIEKWRTGRLKQADAPKATTVNSHVTMIKAVLAKAVAWGHLGAHPLADVKPIKTDKTGRIRYLSPDEEKRLRAALEARDESRRLRREQSNAWRRERGYDEWPTENPDHLTPIVLLALNTGLRKGEIFGLLWSDVDLGRAQLTVRGDGAKSGQTRYVPLNDEALRELRAWRSATDGAHHVFPGRVEGEGLDDIKKGWLAIVRATKIVGFTFHDLRHTFASKLVMAGVDLNTVRELLGHSDIKMTLRYAHLAPEHKAAAVAKLMER